MIVGNNVDARVTALEGKLDKIVSMLTPKEKPKVDVTTTETRKLTDETDPLTLAAEELELQSLKDMPTGVSVVRGRYGTKMVNHSQIRMEAINAWKNNRRMGRSISNM